MAIEDGIALAGLTADVKDTLGLSEALHKHQELRKPRTTALRREALRFASQMHLPDGDLQQKRDREALAQLDGDSKTESPFVYTNSSAQQWLYHFDVEAPQNWSPHQPN